MGDFNLVSWAVSVTQLDICLEHSVIGSSEVPPDVHVHVHVAHISWPPWALCHVYCVWLSQVSQSCHITCIFQTGIEVCVLGCPTQNTLCKIVWHITCTCMYMYMCVRIWYVHVDTYHVWRRQHLVAVSQSPQPLFWSWPLLEISASPRTLDQQTLVCRLRDGTCDPW
jgi:hypothetical protein